MAHVPTGAGFLYLAVVLNAFSRRGHDRAKSGHAMKQN